MTAASKLYCFFMIGHSTPKIDKPIVFIPEIYLPLSVYLMPEPSMIVILAVEIYGTVTPGFSLALKIATSNIQQ